MPLKAVFNIPIRVYLTDKLLKEIDILADKFEEGNRTAFIRSCIELGIRHYNKPPEPIQEIPFILPTSKKYETTSNQY